MRGELTRLPDGTRRLVVEFSDYDLVRVPLDRFDVAMLSEKPACLADYLLDAELIARRLHQIDSRKEAGDANPPQ